MLLLQRWSVSARLIPLVSPWAAPGVSKGSLCCIGSLLTPGCGLQVTKYVEREILNHRCLVHPHIVQFKEVCWLVQMLLGRRLLLLLRRVEQVEHSTPHIHAFVQAAVHGVRVCLRTRWSPGLPFRCGCSTC